MALGLGTIPILRQARLLNGGRKMSIFADAGWVGGSEKVLK